jgi:hypothetical protein
MKDKIFIVCGENVNNLFTLTGLISLLAMMAEDVSIF